MPKTALKFILQFTCVLLLGCASSGVPITELRAKADQNDPSAQFQLGVALDLGRGVSKNQSEAASWYRKAAEQGYADAQNSLGSMYQYGEGVPQDYSLSVYWYQKAVDKDNGEAYTSLGYMYDMGLGVIQDRQKAVKLYQRGAEKGSLNGMLNLGVSYWEGIGIEKDLVQAYKWLDLARFYTQTSNNMQLKWRVRGALDEVKKEMTKDQIQEAKQLTLEWDSAHRQK